MSFEKLFFAWFSSILISQFIILMSFGATVSHRGMNFHLFTSRTILPKGNAVFCRNDFSSFSHIFKRNKFLVMLYLLSFANIVKTAPIFNIFEN